jgi:hypothetical protein
MFVSLIFTTPSPSYALAQLSQLLFPLIVLPSLIFSSSPHVQQKAKNRFPISTQHRFFDILLAYALSIPPPLHSTPSSMPSSLRHTSGEIFGRMNKLEKPFCNMEPEEVKESFSLHLFSNEFELKRASDNPQHQGWRNLQSTRKRTITRPSHRAATWATLMTATMRFTTRSVQRMSAQYDRAQNCHCTVTCMKLFVR